MKMQDQDMLQYIWWKNYGLSALVVAIDKFANGKKATAKYMEKPVLSEMLQDIGMTEDEICERELKKALAAEEQWIVAGRNKGLPETII